MTGLIPKYDRNSLRGAVALTALASALVFPTGAQAQSSSTSQEAAPAAAQQQQQPDINQQRLDNADKEGFWGHMNPFARKKWVKKRLDPVNDRLTELDQLNAKNAADIKDVDARAQAGLHQAKTTADAANQTATAANTQAQNAGNVA